MKIPPDWLLTVHPDEIYCFWHPAGWSETKPPSDSSFFALWSPKEGILMEVFVLGLETGSSPDGASKIGNILKDSLAETHPDRRISRMGPYQQETVDNSAALARMKTLGLVGENDIGTEMESPTRGYRFTAAYSDRLIQPKGASVNTTTDYFSLHRNNFVLQLNFKTLSSDYAKNVHQFEIIAASARLGSVD